VIPSTQPLPLASFDQAFPPSALCYQDVNPLTGQPIIRFNVYQGGVRLIDYFAAAICAAGEIETVDNLQRLTDTELDEMSRQIWRISASMVRTRPGAPPPEKKNGGAP
jgi:hypothetical protein